MNEKVTQKSQDQGLKNVNVIYLKTHKVNTNRQ